MPALVISKGRYMRLPKLPIKVRQRLRLLAGHGPRGIALLGLGFMAFMRGLTYVGPSAKAPEGISLLLGWMPIQLLGALWVAIGLYCFFSAYRKKQELALGMLSGMTFLWLVAYLATAVQRSFEGDYLGWLSAAVMLAFYLIVRSLATVQNLTKSEMRSMTKETTYQKAHAGDDDDA